MTTTDATAHCVTCDAELAPYGLDTFPGGICLDCYRQTPDARRRLTAQTVRDTWNIK